MEELNQAFVEYVEEFKKLDTESKKNELLKSIKELIVIFNKLGEIDNIKLENLKTANLLTNESSNSIDIFLDNEFIYLENAKNLIGQYLDKKY